MSFASRIAPRLLVALGLLGVASCSQTPVVVTPRSFEQPGRIAFVCFENTEGGAPVPLARCQLGADGLGDMTYALHGLVTQVSRGEVAAVDLRNNRLLDSDPAVPGFTFVAVGEIPADIAVGTLDPSMSYVTNAGSRDLWEVPTETFRVGSFAAAEQPTVHPVSQGAPGVMALSTDEQTLFVAVPEAGLLLAYPIDGTRHLGAPREIRLSSTVPAQIASSEGADLGRQCPGDSSSFTRPAGAPRAPMSEGTAPRPVQLVVDATANRLLVADDQLPIVHVVDLASGAELAPLPVGVPVLDLAITPPVPVDDPFGHCDAGAACVQYLYAIDALDGSVLVADASTGAVLTTNAGDRATQDRIPLRGVARGVAVVVSDYPGLACNPGTSDASLAAPTRLRGVFVAVSMTDGTIRFIDVHDLDAPCRGGAMCASPSTSTDAFVSIRRHRPRIGTFIADPIQVLNTPTVALAGQTYAVNEQGVTDATPAPDLSVISCPSGMSRAYPLTEGQSALVCVQTDPWQVESQRWFAEWDGAIPDAAFGRGRFDATTPRLDDGSIGLCGYGILGARNVPTGDAPEAGYGGDAIVITSELPRASSRPDCAAIFAPARAPGQALPKVVLPIVEAFDDHVVLADQALVDGAPIPYAQVATCFDEIVSYAVHVNDAYVVVGDLVRFLHRVHADTSGRCEVDASLPATRVGRAFPGRPFSNGRVAFQIAPAEFGDDSVVLAFTIVDVPPKLLVDLGSLSSGRAVGSLPTVLRNSATDRKLYGIDVAARGLVQVTLDPVSVTHTFE